MPGWLLRRVQMMPRGQHITSSAAGACLLGVICGTACGAAQLHRWPALLYQCSNRCRRLAS